MDHRLFKQLNVPKRWFNQFLIEPVDVEIEEHDYLFFLWDFVIQEIFQLRLILEGIKKKEKKERKKERKEGRNKERLFKIVEDSIEYTSRKVATGSKQSQKHIIDSRFKS
ncbi:hypothetical protein BpHYR1_027834 [Brachionus plicatilis]|uniref:Uncharacterized protein n=1 Tax=Brachionus plicatilis TaxID=10195 RepID=A0A3M7RI58_BRAPC|nr:hypothetical protein BpHYR1_027834 [Brachionus plicatilis]